LFPWITLRTPLGIPASRISNAIHIADIGLFQDINEGKGYDICYEGFTYHNGDGFKMAQFPSAIANGTLLLQSVRASLIITYGSIHTIKEREMAS
jgi:hypothetical protein